MKTQFTPVQFNHTKAKEFYDTLKSRVKEYFHTHNISDKGDWTLHLKTGILVGAWVGLLLLIMLVTRAWWSVMLSYVGLGIVGALIGFNVMHDGGHGSYSKEKWVNNLMGHAMNMLGSDIFLWKVQHNVLHHTYTNIDGYDNDINAIPVFRFHPEQPLKRYHRYQHLYCLPVYGLGTFVWLFVSDYHRYFTKKIGSFSFKPMKLPQHIIFRISKVSMLTIYFILPLLAIGRLKALVGLLVMFFCMSVFLDVVFQMAHVMEDTAMVTHEDYKVDNHWIVHELDTTANFAMKSKFWTRLLGGLNYQVEHHLFPHISHIHYPAIAPIVQQLCKQYGLPYHTYETVPVAFVSHLRYLREMGRTK